MKLTIKEINATVNALDARMKDIEWSVRTYDENGNEKRTGNNEIVPDTTSSYYDEWRTLKALIAKLEGLEV